MRAVAFVMSLSVLVPLMSLSAQVQLEPGSRVRVTAPEIGIENSVGTCLELSNGSMQFVPLRASSRVDIPLTSITRLDASRGRKGHAAIGFLVGGAVGAIVGVVWRPQWPLEGPEEVCTARTGCDAPPEPLIGAALGVLVGLPVGALIRTERWERVPLDQLRVSLTPQRDGRLGIGFSIVY